jgi:hypothetical protein
MDCAEYSNRSGSEYGMWGGHMKKRRKESEAAPIADDTAATG